jgi:hypothetical protein
MSTLAVRPESIDEIPDLETLKPLGQLLRKVGLSLQAGHRWRLHPTTPLKCWKVGHVWMTTEEALRDFIRCRSSGSVVPRSLSNTLSATRRADVQRAIDEAKESMRSR